jgi:ADP-dependent NAD(P)H-hydrate dehydratase / NAD(P)H-hydrate epimerase
MSAIEAGTEILTPAQMYRADELSGVAENTLIDNAGRAVAEEITRRYGARKTVVLCGPGNNGKDGQVAAHYLKSWGWPVEISDDVSNAELIIDALYGAGLNRDFSKTLADKINNANVPIISIDVPSGLDGLTGRPRGASVKADLTITFFRKKPAHVLLPGRALCGEIVVADIGIPDSVLTKIAPQLAENTKPQLPKFALDTHKYKRGHAIVISGGKLNTGASRLAAQAALKIGAGLVTLVGHADALAVHANHLTSVMLAEIGSPKALGDYLLDARKNVVCIGPAAGVGEPTRRNVKAILTHQAAAVLDADALTSCAQKPAELFDWVHKNPNRSVIMTPHEGEFSRLFNGLIDDAGSKVERTRQAAKISGAIIILKGADTVIAHPDGRAVVNTNAPPSLATAGSGDVLAGILTGLLAQGMDPFKAACAAVWLHGETANTFGANTFTADELVKQVGHM